METLIKELKELRITSGVWLDELDINYNRGVNDAIKVIENYIKRHQYINDKTGRNRMLFNNDY